MNAGPATPIRLEVGQKVVLEGVANPPRNKSGRMDLSVCTAQTVIEADDNQATLTNGWKLERQNQEWVSTLHPGVRLQNRR